MDGNEVERHSSDDEPFAALAFKIMADPYVGKLAFFRVYSGTLESGSYVYNSTKGKKGRIGRILQMHANKREEIEEISPAIEAAKEKGMNVLGPLPPDSAFSQLQGGWYDIMVCMYHDQGHIPTKTIGFVYDRTKQEWKAVEGVNITLGLPIIRTSVDHGTDFYHAGKGTSNELSLVNAIDYALRLAE